jgi:ABC-2 type transport system permease protein
MRQLIPVLVLAAALVFAVLRRRRRTGTGADGAQGGTGAGARPGTAAGGARTGWRVSRLFGVTGLVAGREVRQRLRGRVFRVATVLLLLGVAAAIIIPVATRGEAQPQRVGVVGPLSPDLRAAVATAAASVRAEVRIVPETDQSTARQALAAGQIDVVLVDGDRLVVERTVAGGDTSQTATFVRALAQVLGVERAVRAAGLTASQRARLAAAQPLPVTALHRAPTAHTSGRATAVIGLIALMLMLSQYLTWTLIGVMEEKSSRVVEVLLATLRPLQLLGGKVIGIGVVVFIQAALVAAFALVLAGAVGSNLLHGTAPQVLLAALLWLVLGYAFYSWLYAAAGSMAERQDQVQSLAIPLVLPLVTGYVASLSVISQGGSPPAWFEVLAYLPPTAPFAMTSLVGLDAVTWWQFALSAVLTAVGALAMARLAAVVYRRAILRTGRRVRLREIVADRPQRRTA